MAKLFVVPTSGLQEITLETAVCHTPEGNKIATICSGSRPICSAFVIQGEPFVRMDETVRLMAPDEAAIVAMAIDQAIGWLGQELSK